MFGPLAPKGENCIKREKFFENDEIRPCLVLLYSSRRAEHESASKKYPFPRSFHFMDVIQFTLEFAVGERWRRKIRENFWETDTFWKQIRVQLAERSRMMPSMT